MGMVSLLQSSSGHSSFDKEIWYQKYENDVFIGGLNLFLLFYLSLHI